ncbi:FHA domain-containing protein [Spironucleus salmonicida]|uniref:FHA domain-containing protein n=1 Tax=Spironucleus salmonicida TaxID=348837 RepID=V6LD82_9EUKA|nr:FHA domain-containing protein [Spironucleus salmonicida]|eukprot:EST41636.1 hypothetical protein SS50377_18992 [Spironucleus salmonicida]
MLHAAFVDQVRTQQTPSRVTIAKLNPENQTHDRPHSYACIVAGRSPTSDIVLRDPSTSRLHCIIYFKNDTPFIRDLDSRIGTIVNGQQIPSFKDFPVAKNDVISLAGERFLIVSFDQKGMKSVVPASEILQETVVNCPFCGGQAYSFSEAMKAVIAEIDLVSAENDKMLKDQQYQRERIVEIQSNLARIYSLHSAHYANVIQGRNLMNEEAENRANLEGEELVKEELRMSQLSQISAKMEEEAKKVQFNEKSPEIIKKSVFSSFVSLFKSKKAEEGEPEAKSVREHKPTPFAGKIEYEEEEAEKEGNDNVLETVQQQVVEEKHEGEEEEKNGVEMEESATEKGEEQQEKKSESSDKPPSYHFEGEQKQNEE